MVYVRDLVFGTILLSCASVLVYLESGHLQKDRLIQQAYSLVDTNNNYKPYQTPEQEELLELAESLGVIGSDEILTVSDLEKRIKRAPLDKLKEFIEEKK